MEKIFRLRQDLHIRQSCGIDYIYVPAYEPSGRPKQGKLVVFNDTSILLWDKLQPMQSFTLQDVASILCEEYEIDEPLALRDSKALLAKWYQSQLLLIAD